MQYLRAKMIADRIVELMAPHCIACEIAGSIRREKADVGDIEIVAMPRYEFVKTDLFGGGNFKLPEAFPQVIETITHERLRGQPNGRHMQVVLKGSKAVLDLFMPQSIDYYRILAIRTGSADYAHHVIAAAWKAAGWCGTPDGLRRIDECQKRGDKWYCGIQKPTLPPVWTSEQEFFQWLGIEYIHPRDREYFSKPLLKADL